MHVRQPTPTRRPAHISRANHSAHLQRIRNLLLSRGHSIMNDTIPAPFFQEEEYEDLQFSQFLVLPGNEYMPIGAATPLLPPGIYHIEMQHDGAHFVRHPHTTRDLIRFEDTICDQIIEDATKFWTLKALYQKMGESHKRGYILHGPPGGGKTSLISFIVQDFIAQGNLVFEYTHMLPNTIARFRQVEPDRKILIIIEDIDAILNDPDEEHQLLQFLDGTVQLTDTLIIATTNYPEDLQDRIINRPSRFDRVAEIGMPGPAERRKYIETKQIRQRTQQEIEELVAATDLLSFAHIKEILVSTDIYGNSYEETLQRVLSLRNKPTSESSTHRKVGFHD